ncbi:hypothetical protein SAMN04487911_1101 [Arenibacter nanhaiticus]|uniref:Uncharacterized protein n=1 Tax=Arenibacter nanhaiticus TaxID=558155 RepID=A0A1M6G2E3_9FLAO|nr:hypothetical protein [Arenibacter nanhaiticus]SHJ04151.1 hypothetical protein SAMN04487911_1101 [Arenibacter nanhaiticus]
MEFSYTIIDSDATSNLQLQHFLKEYENFNPHYSPRVFSSRNLRINFAFPGLRKFSGIVFQLLDEPSVNFSADMTIFSPDIAEISR